MRLQAAILSMAATLICANAQAQSPACEGLSPEAKAVAQNVMDTSYSYACCDETISACLKNEPSCKLPKLLASEACRLAGAGKSAADIKHIFDQRAMSMGALGKAAVIEKRPEHLWGNSNAKVVVSIYLCARCPYCSRHVPALIEALEKSPLKDKVALNLRMFPIKSHDNSTPAALGVEAAAQLGQAWPFLLKVYKNFDNYSNENLVVWAKELGLDEASFNQKMQDSTVRNIVVTSKKEGLTNNVESTPTFFINGHKIQGTFDVQSMLSMIEEAAE